MPMEAHEPISESFEDWLRRSLIEADEWLRHEVAKRILEQGAAAVSPLIQILEDRALLDAPGEGWAPIHAAVLLGELRANEAIPALLAALADESHREFLAAEAAASLMAIGPAALEPVLRAHAESSDPYHLMALESILCSLAVRDERILTTLLGTLERMPEYGACCMALYGDERAIEPLCQAFDRCDLDPDVCSGDLEAAGEIRAAIQRLGGSLSEEQERRYFQASERWRVHAWPRSERDGAAAKSKQKRRGTQATEGEPQEEPARKVTMRIARCRVRDRCTHRGRRIAADHVYEERR